VAEEGAGGLTASLGLFGVALLLIGVGLFFVLYLGRGEMRRLRAWETRATRTMATVVRHEVRTYKGNTYHRPVARFVTPAGQEVVFEADLSPRVPDPPVGGPLEVLYDAEAPTVARLPGQGRAGAIFMAAVGALFVAVGGVMAIVLLTR
jgi:hypothetical protein